MSSNANAPSGSDSTVCSNPTLARRRVTRAARTFEPASSMTRPRTTARPSWADTTTGRTNKASSARVAVRRTVRDRRFDDIGLLSLLGAGRRACVRLSVLILKVTFKLRRSAFYPVDDPRQVECAPMLDVDGTHLLRQASGSTSAIVASCRTRTLSTVTRLSGAIQTIARVRRPSGASITGLTVVHPDGWTRTS